MPAIYMEKLWPLHQQSWHIFIARKLYCTVLQDVIVSDSYTQRCSTMICKELYTSYFGSKHGLFFCVNIRQKNLHVHDLYFELLGYDTM